MEDEDVWLDDNVWKNSAWFGIANGNIEEARGEVERIFNVALIGRSGLSYGNYYSRDTNERPILTLRGNWHSYEDGTKSVNYDYFPLILEVFDCDDIDQYEKEISKSELLKGERYEFGKI